MAVQRKRRPKRSRGKGRRLLQGLALPGQRAAAAEEKGTAAASDEAAAAPGKQSKRRRSLREVLYDNAGEGLFRLVLVLPLFMGAWLAAGLVLDEVVPFLLVTGAIIFAHYEENFRRQEVVFGRELRLLVWASQAGMVLLFYNQTNSLPAAGCAALAILLVYSYSYLTTHRPLLLIAGCAAIVLQMSLFALLGILSQAFARDVTVAWQHAALGFVPGFALAAAFVARHAEVLETAGWERSVIKKRNGRAITRPGRASTLFSLLLVIGPVIPVTVAPLPKFSFPTPFLVCALSFFVIPGLAQSFMERRQPDMAIAVHCTNLAAGLCLAVFAAAWLSARML